MENLSEKLKQVGIESFETWFERWYKNEDLENTLLVSAKKGFEGYKISIKDEEEETQRRMTDTRFIFKLREKLGKGIKVSLAEEKKYRLLGNEMTEYYISIIW